MSHFQLLQMHLLCHHNFSQSEQGGISSNGRRREQSIKQSLRVLRTLNIEDHQYSKIRLGTAVVIYELGDFHGQRRLKVHIYTVLVAVQYLMVSCMVHGQ